MVRKDRKPRELPLAEIPHHIVESLEHNPELAGRGNSADPRDNIWHGYQGDFDADAALAIDGDPEGALAQIVTAIVNSNVSNKPEYEQDRRVNSLVAKMLGRKARSGPRPGEFDRSKMRTLLQHAAYRVYERRLDPTLGSCEWKICIWASLTRQQMEQLYPDGYDGEKFGSFYNECMKLMRKNGNEDRLLLEASVRDGGVGEVNLEQARWRQDTINRVIHDLTALGIVKR